VSALQDKTVLIISRDCGNARAVAPAVSRDGGRVVAAGLHPDDLAEANRGADFGIEHVDVADEPSIAALAAPTNCFLTGVSKSNPVHGGERASSRQKRQSDIKAIRCPAGRS
jgi:NAD(P)-dependent dehydrogenase (short-subunit alcohol dehydrogenase family)